MALDQSAWFFPQLGYRGIYTPAGIGDGTDYPGIGMNLSQVSIANSILTFTQDNNQQTYAGGPGQNGPATLPLIGGTMYWNKLQMLYGTVEVRGKLGGTGSHTTFWMFDSATRQTVYSSNPAALTYIANEIDIAEGVPFITGDTVTLRQNTFITGNSSSSTTTVSDYSQNFHVYRMEWTPTSVTWFVDGVQTNTTAVVPNRPLFFIVDVEQTDAGSGPTNPANFPQTVQIDYVKAWDQNNNLIFSDDFDGGPAFQELTMSNLVFAQGKSGIGASGTSFGLAYPNSTTSKSFLFALVLAGTASTTLSVTDSLGNTWKSIGAPVVVGGNTYQLFACPQNIAPGGANTVTLHSTTSAVLVVVLGEYTGQAAINPIDAVAAANNWPSTAASIGPVKSTGTNEMAIFIAWLGGSVNATNPSGTIRLNTSSGPALDGVIMDSPALTPHANYIGTWTNDSFGGVGYAFTVKSTSTITQAKRGTRSK